MCFGLNVAVSFGVFITDVSILISITAISSITHRSLKLGVDHVITF